MTVSRHTGCTVPLSIHLTYKLPLIYFMLCTLMRYLKHVPCEPDSISFTHVKQHVTWNTLLISERLSGNKVPSKLNNIAQWECFSLITSILPRKEHGKCMLLCCCCFFFPCWNPVSAQKYMEKNEGLWTIFTSYWC